MFNIYDHIVYGYRVYLTCIKGRGLVFLHIQFLRRITIEKVVFFPQQTRKTPSINQIYTCFLYRYIVWLSVIILYCLFVSQYFYSIHYHIFYQTWNRQFNFFFYLLLYVIVFTCFVALFFFSKLLCTFNSKFRLF